MEQVRSARRHLADLMDDRREELRLTWEQVAQLAGVSRETIRQTRMGDSEIRPLTRRGIEDALQWEAGSIAAILDGGQPTVASEQPGPPLHPVPEVADERLDRMEEDFRQAREALERLEQAFAKLRQQRNRDTGG